MHKSKFFQTLRKIYLEQDKIPPLIDNIEGLKEQNLQNYYVKLKTIIKEDSDSQKTNQYEEIKGYKNDVEINDIFIKNQGSGSDKIGKILILGGAGVGKSTLMQYMSYKWSSNEIWNKQFDVVYRITLKILLSSDWLREYDKNEKQELLRCFIHFNIVRNLNYSQKQIISVQDVYYPNHKSKILLLLDGYDEIAHLRSNNIYKEIEQQIFQFDNLIFTSRPNAVNETFKKKFQRIVENTGLDEEGVQQYFQIYFQDDQENKLSSLEQFLNSNISIKKICNVPVNIAMLCYIWHETNDVKQIQISSMSQLYEKVVNKLTQRFVGKKEYNMNEDIENEIKKQSENLDELQILKHVAYNSFTGGGMSTQEENIQETLIIKGSIRKEDLMEQNQNNISIKSSIQYLVKTNLLKQNKSVKDVVVFGLLKIEGQKDTLQSENQDYSFIHLSFQEYLVCLYLAEKIIQGTLQEKADVSVYIQTRRNESRLLMMLKLLAGEITHRGNLDSVKLFWGSILCNSQGSIEFNIDSKIKLLMHLLGQSKVKGEIDKRIPELDSVISLIDAVVLNDIIKFNSTIKDSDYLSPNMKIVLEGFLQNLNYQSYQMNQIKPQKNNQIQSLIDSYKCNLKQIEPNKLQLIGLSCCSNIFHKIDCNLMFLAKKNDFEKLIKQVQEKCERMNSKNEEILLIMESVVETMNIISPICFNLSPSNKKQIFIIIKEIEYCPFLEKAIQNLAKYLIIQQDKNHNKDIFIWLENKFHLQLAGDICNFLLSIEKQFESDFDFKKLVDNIGEKLISQLLSLEVGELQKFSMNKQQISVVSKNKFKQQLITSTKQEQLSKDMLFKKILLLFKFSQKDHHQNLFDQILNDLQSKFQEGKYSKLVIQILKYYPELQIKNLKINPFKQKCKQLKEGKLSESDLIQLVQVYPKSQLIDIITYFYQQFHHELKIIKRKYVNIFMEIYKMIQTQYLTQIKYILKEFSEMIFNRNDLNIDQIQLEDQSQIENYKKSHLSFNQGDNSNSYSDQNQIKKQLNFTEMFEEIFKCEIQQDKLSILLKYDDVNSEIFIKLYLINKQCKENFNSYLFEQFPELNKIKQFNQNNLDVINIEQFGQICQISTLNLNNIMNKSQKQIRKILLLINKSYNLDIIFNEYIHKFKIREEYQQYQPRNIVEYKVQDNLKTLFQDSQHYLELISLFSKCSLDIQKYIIDAIKNKQNRDESYCHNWENDDDQNYYSENQNDRIIEKIIINLKNKYVNFDRGFNSRIYYQKVIKLKLQYEENYNSLIKLLKKYKIFNWQIIQKFLLQKNLAPTIEILLNIKYFIRSKNILEKIYFNLLKPYLLEISIEYSKILISLQSQYVYNAFNFAIEIALKLENVAQDIYKSIKQGIKNGLKKFYLDLLINLIANNTIKVIEFMVGLLNNIPDISYEIYKIIKPILCLNIKKAYDILQTIIKLSPQHKQEIINDIYQIQQNQISINCYSNFKTFENDLNIQQSSEEIVEDYIYSYSLYLINNVLTVQPERIKDVYDMISKCLNKGDYKIYKIYLRIMAIKDYLIELPLKAFKPNFKDGIYKLIKQMNIDYPQIKKLIIDSYRLDGFNQIRYQEFNDLQQCFKERNIVFNKDKVSNNIFNKILNKKKERICMMKEDYDILLTLVKINKSLSQKVIQMISLDQPIDIEIKYPYCANYTYFDSLLQNAYTVLEDIVSLYPENLIQALTKVKDLMIQKCSKNQLGVSEGFEFLRRIFIQKQYLQNQLCQSEFIKLIEEENTLFQQKSFEVLQEILKNNKIQQIPFQNKQDFMNIVIKKLQQQKAINSELIYQLLPLIVMFFIKDQSLPSFILDFIKGYIDKTSYALDALEAAIDIENSKGKDILSLIEPLFKVENSKSDNTISIILKTLKIYPSLANKILNLIQSSIQTYKKYNFQYILPFIAKSDQTSIPKIIDILKLIIGQGYGYFTLQNLIQIQPSISIQAFEMILPFIKKGIYPSFQTLKCILKYCDNSQRDQIFKEIPKILEMCFSQIKSYLKIQEKQGLFKENSPYNLNEENIIIDDCNSSCYYVVNEILRFCKYDQQQKIIEEILQNLYIFFNSKEIVRNAKAFELFANILCILPFQKCEQHITQFKYSLNSYNPLNKPISFILSGQSRVKQHKDYYLEQGIKTTQILLQINQIFFDLLIAGNNHTELIIKISESMISEYAEAKSKNKQIDIEQDLIKNLSLYLLKARNQIFKDYDFCNDQNFQMINLIYLNNDEQIKNLIKQNLIEAINNIEQYLSQEFLHFIECMYNNFNSDLQAQIKEQLSQSNKILERLKKDNKVIKTIQYIFWCKHIQITFSTDLENQLKTIFLEILKNIDFDFQEIIRIAFICIEDSERFLLQSILSNNQKQIESVLSKKNEKFQIIKNLDIQTILKFKFSHWSYNNVERQHFQILCGQETLKSFQQLKSFKYIEEQQRYLNDLKLKYFKNKLSDKYYLIKAYIELIYYIENNNLQDSTFSNCVQNTLNYLLNFLSEEGEQWLKQNISKLIKIAQNSNIVIKVSELILNNSNIKQEDYQTLTPLISSGINISINQNGILSIEGNKQKLSQNQENIIFLDQEICNIIQTSMNPFISQYKNLQFELFSRSEFSLPEIIQDFNSIVFEQTPLSFTWLLIELRGYTCEDIVFLERKDIFGKRIIFLIKNMQGEQKIWIFDNDRFKVFGEYQNPQMFFGTVIEIGIQDAFKIIKTANYDSHMNQIKLKKSQCFYLDALLKMEFDPNRMQDMVFFQFSQTLRDHQKSLSIQLQLIQSLSEIQRNNICEYFDAFVNTFGISYTEASMIVSGKFQLDLNSLTNIAYLTQKAVFKIISLIPFVGQISDKLDEAVTTISEYVQTAKMQKNAKKLLTIANNAQQSSLIGGIITKIVLNKNKMKEILDLEDQQNQTIITDTFLKKIKLLFSKLSKTIGNIKNDIIQKYYGNLFKTPYQMKGNQDALKIILMFISSESAIEKNEEALERFFFDCIVPNNQTQQQQTSMLSQVRQPNSTNQQNSCCCCIF